jgi:hypothetical protein
VGRLAKANFDRLGSGGGHRTMARAEFDLSAAASGDLELFIYKRLLTPVPRETAAPRADAPGAGPAAAQSGE